MILTFGPFPIPAKNFIDPDKPLGYFDDPLVRCLLYKNNRFVCPASLRIIITDFYNNSPAVLGAGFPFFLIDSVGEAE
jgi:hypothetical protein